MVSCILKNCSDCCDDIFKLNLNNAGYQKFSRSEKYVTDSSNSSGQYLVSSFSFWLWRYKI